jgi:hypothetical protein
MEQSAMRKYRVTLMLSGHACEIQHRFTNYYEAYDAMIKLMDDHKPKVETNSGWVDYMDDGNYAWTRVELEYHLKNY